MDTKETVVQQVEDLLDRYQQTLAKSKSVIELKDQLIELLESEIVLRKKQNLILASLIIAMLLVFAFILLMYCIL